MAKMLRVLTMCSAFLQPSYGQPVQHGEVNADTDFCRVERYVTDIRRVGSDAAEIAVNILLLVDADNAQCLFRLSMPDAEDLKLTSHSVKLYGKDGKSIRTRKSKLPAVAELGAFRPGDMVDAGRLAQGAPLRLELDYKLLVINPKGFYEWPAVVGNSTVGKALLRVNVEEADDFELSATVEGTRERSVSTGGLHYIWSVEELTLHGSSPDAAGGTPPLVRIQLR